MSGIGFGDLNGDLAPDVAIGRLPVQTVAEARTLVEKLGRESLVVAEGVSRHLFVTDNQGRDDPSFRDNAARMAALFSASTEATFADLSDGWSRARSTMIESLAAGSGFTSYFGHGGPERWADEDLFTVEDVPLLLGLKETVLLMWACQSQYYASPYGPSLGEALLLLPQGGAVASIGPSAISSTGGQEVLYRELYRALSGRRPLTLGEAFRRAKVKAARSTNEARDALLGFNLLGDPALRIR